MQHRSLLLLSISWVWAAAVPRIRRGSHFPTEERSLQTGYYSTTDLGAPNITAALGNPLKGLVGGVRFSTPPLDETIPLSMEWYNIGLKEVMTDFNTFDWTVLDDLLAGSAKRRKHAAFSFYISWGNDGGSQLPTFLGDLVERFDLINTTTGEIEGETPGFGDPNLLTALDNFIAALGQRYDGDKRIAAIHLGLLGFWGEFHTFPFDANETIVPPSAKQDVADWFFAAFTQTQVQARYPDPETVDRFGFYDGSFTYSTLNDTTTDQCTPGSRSCLWYFLPSIEEDNQQLAWRNYMIAGETFPDLQEYVFNSTATNPAISAHNQQDFIEAAARTHASWVLHHDAFSRVYRDTETSTELSNALEAHGFLGYNFVVEMVELFHVGDAIDIQVTLRQDGIAPFYYDLGLEVDCYDLAAPIVVNGVEADLVGEGDEQTYLFQGLPLTSQCVQYITVRLVSSMLYSGTRIKFAQGSDGIVILDVPLPPGVSPTPTVVIMPSSAPSLFPIAAPTYAPVAPYEVLQFVTSETESSDVANLEISAAWTTVYCNTDQTEYFNTGDYDPSIFECHRWTGAGEMTYTFSGLNPEVTHPLRIGFVENFAGNCQAGSRVVRVNVNGEPFVTSLDVVEEVGCYTAYWVTQYVTTSAAGELEIFFGASVNNPFVTFIEIGNEVAPSTAPSIVPSSKPSLGPTEVPAESLAPSTAPSSGPSMSPVEAVVVAEPSSAPSSTPSVTASNAPSVAPSGAPSSAPTVTASNTPSVSPSGSPTSAPSVTASNTPSLAPTGAPSVAPSMAPSDIPPSGPSWESLIVPSVSDTWQTVGLAATFTSPVVVCSVQYTSPSNIPAVVRIRNRASGSFDIRLQNPGDQMTISTGRPVHCVVVEEGVWQLPDGRVVEAVQYTSTVTAWRNRWLAGVTSRPLAYTGFTTPIVLGQVMSYNDAQWSTFVTCGSRRQQVPTRTVVQTGKHAGEDSDTTRADEVLGYIVLERAVHSTMPGNAAIEMEASRGNDIVRGFTQSQSYQYNFVSSFNGVAPEVTVVSQNAMDGTDGSYAIVSTGTSATAIQVALDEDQIRDSERSHTTEQVAYVAMSSAGVLPLTAVV